MHHLWETASLDLKQVRVSLISRYVRLSVASLTRTASSLPMATPGNGSAVSGERVVEEASTPVKRSDFIQWNGLQLVRRV